MVVLDDDSDEDWEPDDDDDDDDEDYDYDSSHENDSCQSLLSSSSDTLMEDLLSEEDAVE